MAENRFGSILRTKVFGYFLIFWGATFLLRAIADILYYIFNYGSADFTETIAETTTWIMYDVVSIGAAITLWIISMKVLQAKSQQPT